MKHDTRRVIVAITGSSGSVLGVRTLELLKETGIETHLVISNAARRTLAIEMGWKVEQVEALASASYLPDDTGSKIASGSFLTMGMLVVPCSIKTLSGIANSYASNLIVRAADVCLKEGKPVILAVRETPLHAGHLRLMKLAARAGVIIYPPIPSFYGHPATIDDLLNNIVGRMLLRLGIDNEHYSRWTGE